MRKGMAKKCVSDRGVSVRVAIHDYPPVKPMIIEAPEMILELRATVDSNGRMEYQLSNYFANPTDLKALAPHLPEGSCLILLEDGSLSVEEFEEGGVGSSMGFSEPNYSMTGGDVSKGGDNWESTGLNHGGKTLGGIGLINKGRELVEWEYLSQARYNRVLSGDFSKPIKHTLRGLKNTGRILGGAGIVLTGVDIGVNGINVSNSLDLVMGGVAFIPVAGWAVSGTYFIANIATELITGESIGEHIQGTFTDPNASYKVW